ncbi:hypothetical protein BJX68DRAFT_245724 [Aspergillus pseudodeflectus]|uniref:RanBP2-type domain-containing protein n=1 Tax=Aspergillus pseudodeflectus TaxID=176178 RepID=A0ABR4JMR9_9EURO
MDDAAASDSPTPPGLGKSTEIAAPIISPDRSTMAAPLIHVPKTEGGWTCCKCNGYNPSTSSECKDCTNSHPKCNLCTNDTDLPMTQMMNGSYYYSQPPSIMEFPRPDMDGWWLCCHCGWQVNPALGGYRCTTCGHDRCTYCSPY